MARSRKSLADSGAALNIEMDRVVGPIMLHTAAPTMEAVAKSDTGVYEEAEESKHIPTTGAIKEEKEGFRYPKKASLAAVTLALCLSVFCISLVSVRLTFDVLSVQP